MKRKITAVLLILCCLFAFVGCAEEETNPGEGTINPWREISEDDLKELTGTTFGLPEGVSRAALLWNGSERIAEMIFTLDGIEWTARIRTPGKDEDLTGVWFSDEAQSEECLLGTIRGTVRKEQTTDDSGSKVWLLAAQWNDPAGIDCSLSGFCESIPEGLAETVFLMK